VELMPQEMKGDNKLAAAVGRRVKSEFEERYGGAKDVKMIRVNGRKRPANVYGREDWEWIRGIVEEMGKKQGPSHSDLCNPKSAHYDAEYKRRSVKRE